MPSQASQLPQPATRDDFEVAIFCALPREAKAVEFVCDRLFLEDDGQEYGKHEDDKNYYTTGRIGYHSVVIVWLEHMGKESAARASTSLRMSYRRIWLALLVGICGGSPLNTSGGEILLGDVVISSQIHQYDFKKLYPSGDEVRDTTRHMKNDPAVSAIVDRLADGSGQKFTRQLAEHVKALTAKQISSIYDHPGPMNDILFQPEYLHKHRHEGIPTQSRCMTCSKSEASVCKEARDMACVELGCDPKSQVQRIRLDSIQQLFRDGRAGDALHPHVHFGVMGCGDTVIKSGKHRDEILKQSRVIAVEMESAGVFGSFAGIVIKSVCDYADSHKHKIWQDYAAGTAASAAKALLSSVTPTDRANMATRTRDLSDSPSPEIHDKSHAKDPPRSKHRIWINFIDRNDILRRMERVIFSEMPNGQQKRFAVCGMAGIGKTQLCLKFASIHKGRKFQHVFEVDASSRAAAERDFGIIAEWAGLKATFENGMMFLANCRDDWLLILDHVDNKGFSIHELLPDTDLGCVLITTRSTDLIYEKVNLNEEPMTMDEGVTLFLKDAAKDPTNQQYRRQAESLVKELGCLPLALHHAAGPVRRKLCPLGDMGYYQRNKEALLNGGNQGSDEGTYEYSSVYASIGMSLQTMTAPPELRGLGRALEILQICAFLHFKDIPEAIFNSAPSRGGNQGLLRTAQNGLSSLFSFTWLRGRRTSLPYKEDDPLGEPASIREALDCITSLSNSAPLELNGSSFLDENREALALLNSSSLGSFDVDSGLFSLHPVVHEWNRSRLSGQDLRWARWSAGVALSHSIPHDNRGNKHGHHRRDLLSHVDFFLRTGHASHGVPENLTIDQARVAEKFSLVYQDNGNYRAARALCGESLDTMQRSLGKASPDTLRSLQCLAVVLEKQRHYKMAAEHSKNAWEGFESLQGGSSEEALKCLNTYASSLHGLGIFPEAEAMHRDVLRRERSKSAPNAASIAETVNNLAMAILMQGKPREAIQHLTKAYHWRKRELGEKNAETMQSLHDLAFAHREAGEVKKAVTRVRQVLGHREQVLGKRHPDTLASMIELALIERKLGNIESAERLSKEARDGMENCMGSTNPDTLESLSSLASALRSQGHYQQAERLCKRILRGYKEQFAPTHVDVLKTKSNLAGVLTDLRRSGEAEEIYREIVSEFKAQLGSHHPDVIKCQINFAVVLAGRTDDDKLNEADAIHREIESEIERSHPNHHILKSDWLFNYAVFLRKRENYGKAAEKITAAMEGYKAKLGWRSPSALDSLAALAFILDLQGNYEAAWERYTQALEGYGVHNSPTIHHKACEQRFTAMRDKMRALGIPEPERVSDTTETMDEETEDRPGRKRGSLRGREPPAVKKLRES